ncbi:unnamed protein product [Closterium sp. NIES-53]
MASLRILAFDHERHPIQFDTWLDDLQLYLLSDSRDSVSLFDHTSGAAPAPPATADTQALYHAVVARYSSPATAALGRLLVPYLFCELSAFATVEELASHLHTSDARYHAAALAEFLERNQPPMFITLYFIVTRLPDSLRSVMDHFLSLDPTVLTVDLLKQHLFTVETSVVAVGAARGTPRTPFFEGCSPSPLAPSYNSAAVVDVPGAEDVGAASTSAKHCSSKGKGGRGGGDGSGGGGGGSSGGGGGNGGGGSSGSGGRSGGFGGVGVAAVGVAEVAARGASGGSGSCAYVIRTGGHAGQTCRKPHIQHCCFSRLDDAWRAKFGDEAERPCWAELLRSRVAIFDLDYDVILAAMYALSVSAEGDCYLCVPLDPSIEAAALGASESVLPETAPAKALHTFTLNSVASRCFFRDSTTLTPLSAPVQIRLADPSGGPVLAHSSTVLPCSAVLCGSLSGLQPPLVLYELGPVDPPCSCRLLSHHTLLWHHRLGHPSLQRLRGMHSRLLVFDLPRSLPPLPPLPAPPCLPCVKGWQRAAPHSSSFPPTSAPPSGDFSSDLLWDFCRGEGILHSFTLPDSPQQNGIAERRIGLVMEVARTSMIHAAALHFLWPFAVRYAAHQLNLWRRVSLPETSPTLRWTGKVGDASVFWVLQRFGFTYSSPQSTPLPTGHSLSAPPSDESVEPSGPYPELVGCLMYLMTCTRPDLAYPLSLLARYVAPAPDVMLRSTLGPWLHRSYAGSPIC